MTYIHTGKYVISSELVLTEAEHSSLKLDSPDAFEYRDVVLLSFPWCEVNAGLQSVLVKRFQRHSLCIHVYMLQNVIHT